MYWAVVDKYTIETLKPKGDKPLLIRILDQEENEPEYYKNYIEFYLDDMPYEKEGNRNITNEDFKKINNFILNNEFDEIVVHCTLGISRSPAIMLFIAKILNREDMVQQIKEYSKFIPNKLITKKIREYDVTKKPFEGQLIFRNNEIYKNLPRVDLEYDKKEKCYIIRLEP